MTTSSLDIPYPLTQEQISRFADEGHVYLPQLLDKKEVNVYRAEITRLVARMNTETRALKDRDTYGKAFLQIFNLWLETEMMKRFVLGKRFGDVAAQLMGVEQVRIYHDQALFKEAGGGHTPWHQDQFYWPLDTDKTITMWMPLMDLTKDMGIMQFVSGSHMKGHILTKEISDESDDFFASYIAEHNLSISSLETARAGDATFHAGWTLHHAPPNMTSTTREVMTIIYYADKAKILQPDNPFRENDLARWLGGKKADEIADSALNPLIE